MTKRLAIYGAGGFGRETAAMVEQINLQNHEWELIGFFDDGFEIDTEVDGLKIVGNVNDLNSYPDNLAICIAVADPTVRHSLVKRITNVKISFPVLVHPQANLGDRRRNKFGKGSIVTAGVILTTGIEIGEFGIINLSTTIGHDVKLGSCCTVMPGCSISGNVSMGSCCVVGTGSRIIQSITIGDNCMVGAGSVVTKSFGSNLKILGVPARKRVSHVERV
ncbi:MAG TPA: acetyltransferase [Chitinophagaceae bacterium]|nr:acetyltransferase [Chitinophagaceae bacterium]